MHLESEQLKVKGHRAKQSRGDRRTLGDKRAASCFFLGPGPSPGIKEGEEGGR